MTPLTLIVAMILDRLLGEPKKFHPLVGFGNLTYSVESYLNIKHSAFFSQKIAGIIGWCLLVLPLPFAYLWLRSQVSVVYAGYDLFILADSLILYFALGLKSLKLHAINILTPLSQQDLVQSRRAVGLMVSRETKQLNQQQISRATVESVLENGHDAVIASLFWYVVGGVPMVILHRLANTLDAMWGYKNQRFLHFGWFAAKADDFLGWPSAKITSCVYILSQTLSPQKIYAAWLNAFTQGRQYKSLNGGWVMAAGASALNIQLGGGAEYHGEKVTSCALGQGREVTFHDIERCLLLVEKASWLLISLVLLFSLCWYVFA